MNSTQPRMFHLATRDTGVIEVDILLSGKVYTYYLDKFGYGLFLKYYRKQNLGKALNVLQKFNKDNCFDPNTTRKETANG